MLHRPALLLLDEPTTGADPGTRAALLAPGAVHAADGAAVLYTTHYLPELVDLAATLAGLPGGRVIARGSQAELRAGLDTLDDLYHALAVPPCVASPSSGSTWRCCAAEPGGGDQPHRHAARDHHRAATALPRGDRRPGTARAVTGMLVLFSLMGLSIVGGSLLTERAWHTLDRVRVTPARRGRSSPARRSRSAGCCWRSRRSCSGTASSCSGCGWPARTCSR